MTRLSGPSLVFLASLSPLFSCLNWLKIDSPLSQQTDWTSPILKSKFMELTFSFTESSTKFVVIVIFPAAKYCVMQPYCLSKNLIKRGKIAGKKMLKTTSVHTGNPCSFGFFKVFKERCVVCQICLQGLVSLKSHKAVIGTDFLKQNKLGLTSLSITWSRG